MAQLSEDPLGGSGPSDVANVARAPGVDVGTREPPPPARDEYRIAIDAIPGLVWSSLPDGYIDFLNQRWCEYTGLSMEEAQGWGWQAAVYPDDLPRLLAIWGEVLRSGAPGELVARLRRFDGELRWFLFRAIPLFDHAGRLIKWYGQTTDIDEQKRAEALLAGENHLLEMIAKGSPLTLTLEALCRLVEETAKGSLCGIVLIDTSGTRLQHGAAPSLPASYNDAIHGRPVGTDSGPCATAAHLKQQVIVADITSDTRWEDYGWCPLALAHGLRACWSTPIVSSDGTVSGVFALYSPTPGGPTPDMQRVIAQMTHLAAVAIDRRRTELALHESEQRFRMMADAIPEVIWINDLQPERVLYASPSFESIWGVSLDALYARPRLWREMIHPEDRARVIDTFTRWTGGDGVDDYDVEFRVVQPSGETRWIHERGVLIGDSRGPAYRASGISTDITEARRADEERRRHEAILAEAERLSLTGSSCWRPSSEELIWSRETYRIFEFDPDVPPTTEMMRARIHPDDVAHFDRTVESAVRDGSDFAVEPRLRMPDGRLKYLHVLARAFRDDHGRVIEFIGAVKDVTDRKQSEDALDEVRNELAHMMRVTTINELTASLAHELNQPLLGIVTNASTCLRLLADETPNLEAARDTARRTIRDGNRAADVITRLRALFKKRGPGKHAFDLNDAVQEAIALVGPEVSKSRVALQSELAIDVPPIIGDRVQIQQVLLNLILNACEAMRTVADRPRHLLITTRRSDTAQVRVAVRDSGSGLEATTRERIFQPFFTSKSEGMGMGLSISRSIVESHRGQLHAESHDGPGATFVFTLPIAPLATFGDEHQPGA